MRTIGVRDLRNDVSEIMRGLQSGQAFEMQINRHPIGILTMLPLGYDVSSLPSPTNPATSPGGSSRTNGSRNGTGTHPVQIAERVTIPGAALGPGFSDTTITRGEAVRWLSVIANALSTGQL